MLSLSPIIALLQPKPADFSGKWFRKVGGAAEYAQARKEALPLPMAWVIRYADPAKPAGDAAADVEILFDVVIAVENVRTRDTGETDDALLSYRLAVIARLLGKNMPGSIRPIIWLGGAMIDYTDSDLYYRDRYQLDALKTNYLPDPNTAPYIVDKPI